MSKMHVIETQTFAPELAAALVAAQAEAVSLTRDGSGQHGKYTSSDEIAAVARGLLTRHGLAWVRVGVELLTPTLSQCELGNQAYVGDLIERWALVHESGAAIVTEGSKMPIIASKGRPHDKAVGASLTYDAGAVLRGLLCLDREDKNAIDQRRDEDDGRRQPPPATPPSKLELLQQAVEDKVHAYAQAYEVSLAVAWSEACSMAGHPKKLGGDKGPWGCGFDVLGKINAELKKALAAPELTTEEQTL